MTDGLTVLTRRGSSAKRMRWTFADPRASRRCDHWRSQQIAQLSWRLRRLPSSHGASPTCGFSPALDERRPQTSGPMRNTADTNTAGYRYNIGLGRCGLATDPFPPALFWWGAASSSSLFLLLCSPGVERLPEMLRSRSLQLRHRTLEPVLQVAWPGTPPSSRYRDLLLTARSDSAHFSLSRGGVTSPMLW